jgi:hypothetical protein
LKGLCIFNAGGRSHINFTGNSARLGTTMPDQKESGDRTAVATYVATLSADLAIMARGTGLDTLGYLLEMVRLEAESSARQSPAPNGRR